MPTKTLPHPPRLGRAGATALITLAVLSVLTGIWPIMGTATTFAPVLAIPAALGLPGLIPPLRFTPLGLTTWDFWAMDVAGALVMLVTAWAMLRVAGAKRPHPGFGRAFGRGVWTTIVAVAAGNLVRGVLISFATHADLGTYLGTLGAGLVVSVLVGAIAGLVVGIAAGIAASVRTQSKAGAPVSDAPA